MRLNLAVIAMLMLPALAAAQSTAPVPGGVPALPPLGLPLPQIGLPHPPTGLPAPAAPRTVRTPQADRHGRGSANRHAPRQGKPHRQWPYLVPFYGWPLVYEIPAATSSTLPKDSAVRQPQRAFGRLQFDLAVGGEQQLFIDGYYLGTLGEFASGVELEPGPHAVEIAAPEFETARFSVNIAADRTITYRPALKATTDDRKSTPAASDLPPSQAASTPMVGYIVPGCYIGNVPPQDVGLPASCDVSRTIIIKP
jgi:hypothetical protein